MKFGLAFASSVGTESNSALEICKIAEKVGFESVWGGEHVIFPSSIDSKYPYTADGKVPATKETLIHDPLIWLAYVAAAAPTLRLGTCILILPQRNPLVLAKEISSLDHLSGGRVELGIGVGWLKEEFEALGVPWERRGARTDEYVQALQLLWGGTDVEFHGEFVDFEPVTCTPRPIQSHLPILVGGDSPAAIRRAAKIADGYYPGTGDFNELQNLIQTVRQAAEDQGRDPLEIEIHAHYSSFPGQGDGEEVERMRSIGVGRLMVPAFFFAGPDGLERLERFGEDVIGGS
jgi:probable F420-dependent oxidoreductase